MARSKIFDSFADFSNDFRDDFSLLWDLSENQRKLIIPHVAKIYKSTIHGEERRLREAAVSQIGGDSSIVLRALSLLEFIYRSWDPIHDTADNFFRDMKDLGLIPPEKEKTAGPFFLNFLNEIQKDNARRLVKSYANSLLPSLKNITTVIDFRAVIENPYLIEESPETYEPRCANLTPVIIIEILCDSGTPNRIQFQCEKEDLEIIIRKMQASIKQLECSESYFGGES